MERQIIINAVTTKNDVSVTGSVSSKRYSIQYDENGRISVIGISKITSKNLPVPSNNYTNHDGEIGYNSTIEINSHSDNHFLVNIQIISST